MDQQTQTVGVAIVVAVVLAIIVIMGIRNLIIQQRRRNAYLADRAQRELAIIEEEIRATGGGALAMLLLILTVIIAVFSYSVAKTIFQQIEAGVSLIAGLILFGLGVALGRRRTYRIFRSPNREPM